MNWKKQKSADELKPGTRVKLRMRWRDNPPRTAAEIIQFKSEGTVVEVRPEFRIETPHPEFDNEPPVRPVIVLWHDGRHGCHDMGALEVV